MQQIKYGSVCSGIEAATSAWHGFGWKASWFSEIDAFPSAVLAHHYPEVPNLGDMTKIRDRILSGEVEAPEILVGGTPCQAFSVAGARKSLDDDRGQLTLEYVRLANAIDEKREEPCITVWENVPGVLNTKDNAFGCFLGALAGESGELKPSGGRWSNAGCVFGPQRSIAWRILDAQYFGLAQRRRRVFVVASARKGFNPAKVLFEWESMRRDTAPSRDTGEDVTGSAKSSPYIASGKPTVATLMANAGTQDPIIQDNQAFPLGRNQGQENVVFGIPGNWIGRKPENGGNATEPMDNISPCQTKTDRHAVSYSFDSLASNSMKSSNPHSGCREVDLSKTIDTTSPCPSKNQGGIGILEKETFGIQGSMIGRSETAETAGPQGSGVSDDISFTLTTGDRHGVAYSVIGDVTPKTGEDICMTLRAQGGGGIVPPSVMPPVGLVRRLTPIECERLQGFPDNHTQIPYRNKSAELCPDGPRYAACGNSMAVPVMAWIGNRINEILKNESI